ncbi:hypothetical protein ACWKSP_36555 [Micromonosporaceae bacterium Da 78-11]
MTVSGLGSARTPHPYATMAARVGRVEKAAPNGTDFDRLTSADRELIFQVTGQRIGPGSDPARDQIPHFAAVIAADRAAGRLIPGQEVTAVYLKDVNHRYEQAGGPNPVAEHLDQAVGYLARSGARRIDVTA